MQTPFPLSTLLGVVEILKSIELRNLLANDNRSATVTPLLMLAYLTILFEDCPLKSGSTHSTRHLLVRS